MIEWLSGYERHLLAQMRVPDEAPVIIAAGLRGEEMTAVLDVADRPVLFVVTDADD